MKYVWIVGLFLPLFANAQAPSLKTPNVSADGLFLYRNSNFHKEDKSLVRNGFDIQEAELAFYSDVDPYSRMSILVSIHPEYEIPATGTRVEQKWIFEPEELFVESDHVPGVTLKIGKFKAAFGKHNTLHSHVYPFVDAPLINSNLLTEEGLADAGVSAAALIPVSWYSEFTAQYLRGEGENTEFNSETPGDGVGIARWKNLFELSDALTTEVGASFASGNNDMGGNTTLAGADFTLKWRPVSGGKYHSGIFAIEYIDRKLEQKNTLAEHGNGYSIWAQYQFAERWSAKLRGEYLQIENSNSVVNSHSLDNGITNKGSAQIQFDATEFSFFRLEYDNSHGPEQNGESNEHKIYLQANFTIGSHPAHSY